MTSKGGTKQQVTLYYMSQHFGICSPVDQIRGITVNEKVAWSGSISAQTTIAIDNANLFGGPTKQGGVKGTVYFLPGAATQVLPDNLAQKLGRANGADCPGYRGLASAFFTGPADGQAGFYWTANDPYLPGVWIKVTRRPRGLNQDYAMVPRQGTSSLEFPVTIATDNTVGSPTGFSLDGRTLYQIDGAAFSMWNMDSQTLISTVTLSQSTVGPVAIGPDRIYAQTGPFFAPVLGSFDLGGGDYQEIIGAGGISTATDGCTWAADLVCFYNAANTAGSLTYDPATGLLSTYAVTFGPTGYCTDASNPEQGWVVGTDAIALTGLYLAAISSATTITISGAFDGIAYDMDNGAGQLLVWQQDHFLLIDKTTHLVTATATAVGGGDVAANAFRTVTPGASSLWMGNLEYDTRTLALIRTVDPDTWVTGEWHLQTTIYSPYLHALVTWPAFLSPDLVFRLLDRDSEDANPAHIIYECLTNTDWGMGSPTTLIDTDGFNAAAVELFNEPLGLSMIWTKQATIQDFIQEVLDHIQATLFVDPQSGLLTLKLIRGDYDIATLPTISPSTANLSNFGRKLWGDIVNEINVTWTNPDNEQDETITAHDLASITTQGGIVSDSRNYYGVRYSDLAMRLAARDLRSAAAPLATCDVELDRSYWALRPASVILVDWPQHGLDGVVMRLTSIDYGKPGDPTIKCSLIEDVFGLDVADYVPPPSTLWVNPSADPTAMTQQVALTLPYFLAAQGITTLTGAVYPEVLVGVLGASSNADTFGYELWGEVTLTDGSTQWQSLASLNLVGYAELAASLPAEASSSGVSFTSFVGSVSPARNSLAIIGSGTEAQNELALITAASTTYTLSRGVLDTVPRAWSSGTPVWFVTTDDLIEDPNARSVGEVVSYRLLTRTSKGLLSLYAAPLLTTTLSDRPWLPLRPANVKAYGVAFSSASAPIDAIARPNPWVTVTWSNRDRLTEDTTILAWDGSSITPETGQTTTITVLAVDGTTVLATHSSLTGSTFDVPDASFGSADEVIIRTSSERIDGDGTFESLQSFDHWVKVAATGGSDAFAGLATASFSGASIAGSSSLSAAGVATLSDTGSNAAPYGTHAYWELEIDTVNGSTTGTGFTNLVFYDASGTVIPTTGGTAFSGGSGTDSSAVSNLFDSNITTSWTRSSATNTKCGYQFAAAVAVAKIDIYNGTSMTVAPVTCRLRYSDNGTTYTTAFEIWEPSWPTSGTATRTWPQDFTGNKYKAFRWVFTADNGAAGAQLQEAELHATVGGSDITADRDATNGVAFGSTANVNEDPYRAFDNDTSTDWGIAHFQLPANVGYAFAGATAKPAEYAMTSNSGNGTTWTFNSWTFQGSTDGTTWTTLDTQSGITWSATPQTKTFAVP